MMNASTSPDQEVVVLKVEEFNKVLELIASGIKLATTTSRTSVAQVGKIFSSGLMHVS